MVEDAQTHYHRPMRVGIVMWPDEPWSRAQEQWKRAEQMGFAHGWVYDHLAFRGIRPWHDAYATLASAATVTTRMRLRPLVTSPNFRHPVPTMHTAQTIQAISGGRMTLGLGSGSPDPTTDAGALGDTPTSWRERLDRFAEWVEVADLLLRQPATSYAGQHYSVNTAETETGTGTDSDMSELPFAVAALGPRSMRLAARYAHTWVTLGDPREPTKPADQAVREQTQHLTQACADVGRDPTTLRRLLLTGLLAERPLVSLETFRDLAGRAAGAGITDLVVHWPRASGPFAGQQRLLEQIPTEAAQ